MRRAGVTVLELLVAVGVATIVAATAAPALADLGRTLRLAGAARTLAQRMRETRSRAIATGTSLDVAFDAATRTWRIATIAGATLESQTLPAPVAFASLPAAARVRFGSTGAGTNATIALTSGTATRRIVVNQRGRVRLA